MGQTPAKFFPWPTPFGQSPDSNVVNKAIAPPQAPLNNFLPLNPGAPGAPPALTQNPVNPLGATDPNDIRRRQPMYRDL